MIISVNGYYDYELTFLKHPKDHRNEQMVLDMARNFLKHTRLVDEIFSIKIGEYHCGEKDYNWQISLTAIHSEPATPAFDPSEGVELLCTESGQYYEAALPTNRKESYSGYIDICIAMYSDDADNYPGKLVENNYARMLLYTAYGAYYKAIADWYTEWETRYIDAPRFLECYHIDHL